MFPSQPHRHKSAPTSHSHRQPTRAWDIIHKHSMAGSKDSVNSTWYKDVTDDGQQSKVKRRKSIKLSFRKKLSITSKKNKMESKSLEELIDDKKRPARPLSLLFKPPEMVEDWYKSMDSPLLHVAGREMPQQKPNIPVPRIELSVSSPHLQQVSTEGGLPGPPTGGGLLSGPPTEGNLQPAPPTEGNLLPGPPTEVGLSPSAVLPSDVALAAYPPSPYELTKSSKSFVSYLEEAKMFTQAIARSKSLGSRHAVPPSPLALIPSPRVTTSGQTSEADAGSVGFSQLSFGRRSGRQVLTPGSPASCSTTPSKRSVQSTNTPNYSFGRSCTRSKSAGSRYEMCTATQYPGHNRPQPVPQRVPVKKSPPAARVATPPSSESHRMKQSRSFNAQTSYSADALDCLEGECKRKASSMVCGYGPYVPKGGSSMFRFPFQRGGSERSPFRHKGQRSGHNRSAITAPLRRPSLLTSTSTHNHTFTSSYSGVHRSSTPTSPRISQTGSIISLSAYSDLSESVGSLLDTQSEIWSAGRSHSFANRRSTFTRCRGQRPYQSLVISKRQIWMSMWLLRPLYLFLSR